MGIELTAIAETICKKPPEAGSPPFMAIKINKEKILFLGKKIFCIFLIYSGICRLSAFINRKKVKILLYHGIIDTSLSGLLNRDNLHLPLKSFEKQMAYLKKYYHILGLGEFIEYLKENKPVPRNSVVVTFDDGYKNNYENLKSIVLRYKVPLTIFLTTGYIGKPGLLWADRLELAFFYTKKEGIFSLQSTQIGKIKWQSDEEKMQKYIVVKNYLKRMPHEELQEALRNLFAELNGDATVSNYDSAYTRILDYEEVAELFRCGVRFGSHTCRHEILTALGGKEMQETLGQSYSATKDYCDDGQVPFAYPNGSFNEEVKKSVIAAGYNCALTTMHGFNASGCDLYALKRNEIGNKGDLHIFIATLSGAIDFIKSLIRKR